MVNSTAHDVLLEPTGLIKNNEGKRPGDVVLLLDQFFSDPHHLARWKIASIDVVTCTVPPMVSPPECQQYESKRNLQRSERVKFTGPAIRKDEPPGTLCGLQLIKELMDTGILLMPFAIDAYGSLGPVACKLLYAKDHALTAYDNGENVSDIEEACQEANQSKHAPSAILDRASRNWQRCHAGIPFGSTHSETTPKLWATHNLAMDCLRASMRHLNSHMHRDRFPDIKQSPKIPYIHNLHTRPTHLSSSTPKYFVENPSHLPDRAPPLSVQTVTD